MDMKIEFERVKAKSKIRFDFRFSIEFFFFFLLRVDNFRIDQFLLHVVELNSKEKSIKIGFVNRGFFTAIRVS